MDITAIVYQLRKYCPILKSVAGAANTSILDGQTNMPMPAAFVVPVSIHAPENDSLNSEFQIIKQTFAVVVAIDNTTDARGQLASSVQVNAIFYALMKALVGWYIESEPCYRAVYLGEEAGQNLNDRSRDWWSFTFCYEIVIDQNWGFEPDGTPLTEIDATYNVAVNNTTNTTTNLSFPIDLAQ